ncbi:MAG: carboxypeptidase-like regulatory domain-containing protein [Methanomassiliicoccaceae archaeon]|nr:carboxypeptidase-like regulatory domain-containing protein [Methanomassiliicoccaceae archaeon]
MRYAAASAVALLMLATALLMPFMGGGNAAGAPGDEVTVSGRIVYGLDAYAKPIGLKDVKVTVGTETALSDDDGEFELLIEPGTYEIKFEISGYSVLIWPGAVYEDDDACMVDVNAGGLSLSDTAMVRATGTIYGAVTRADNDSPVQGVTVQVIGPDGKVIASGRTDGDGMYSIECPNRDGYTVSTSSLYLKEMSYENVDLDAGETVRLDFALELKEEATYLFGFDLTHSLMLIGGIIGLFLLIFAISYRIHIGKHPGSSKIYSDPGKKDQE